MAEDHDRDQDRINETWLTPWEQECSEEWERESNMDDFLSVADEQSSQQLWLSFQNSASSIANLYKEKFHDQGSPWVPFQNSASSVTVLYKDSLEVKKNSFDLGVQYGNVKRTKDVLAWARKRRRHIRREELIAYLCGKTPPPRHKPSHSLPRPVVRHSLDRASPKLHHVPQAETKHSPEETDLQPFRDALALQGLNGSMANISVGVSDSEGQAFSNTDFNCYILEEMARRSEGRKRMPSTDIRHDSPSRKRNRLL